MGFESGIDKRFGEARIFYSLFTGLIVCASGFVLIPGLPLLKVILISQVANGVLLPFVLTFMLMLVNRPRLMGEYRNGPWGNFIAGGTSVVMVVLTVVSWLWRAEFSPRGGFQLRQSSSGAKAPRGMNPALQRGR